MDLGSLRTHLVELLLLPVLGELPVMGRWEDTRLKTRLLGLLESRCIMLKSFRGKQTAAWLQHGDASPCCASSCMVWHLVCQSECQLQHVPLTLSCLPWGHVTLGQNRPYHFLSHVPAKLILHILPAPGHLQSSDFPGFSSPQTSAFCLVFP